MSRHPELAAADPELQQSRIDVHQRRAAEPRQQARADGIVEIQQQVSLLEHCLRFVAAHVEILRRSFGHRLVAGCGVENASSFEAIPAHPRAERGQCGFLSGADHVVQSLQPVDLAAKLAKAQHVLHVHPEVSAPFREVGHAIRRDDDYRHAAFLLRS